MSRQTQHRAARAGRIEAGAGDSPRPRKGRRPADPGRSGGQCRTPAEAIQSVLTLLNWQVQILQDALEMLRAPATPSDGRKKGLQRN